MIKKSIILSALLSVYTLSTSIVDASTVKSFKETLSIEEDFSILTHPVFKQFASENPRQVVGLDQIDLDFINSLKAKYSALSDRERDKKINRHDDAFIPQAQKVAKFIKTIDPEGKNTAIKNLLDEIDFMIAKKKVSPVWTIQLSARLAFAMSTPSKDELELLSHVLDRKSRSQLQEPEDLLNVIESVLSYSGTVSVIPDHQTDYPLNVWRDDMDRLFENHTATPLDEIIQPILGEGIISLPVLNTLAAENVTLMGLPTEDKKVSAHGIKGHPDKPGTSVAAFLGHDALHHLLIKENKQNTFLQYLHRKTDAAVGKGDSAERFFERHMPFAAARYRGIHTVLQLALIGLMEDAVDTKKMANFRKAMVGEFYITHEYPGVNTSTLDENSATGVVKNLAQSTLENFEDVTAWESATDPLQTSPFDGSSPLSDEHIIESFIEQVNEGKIFLTALMRYSYLSGTQNEISNHTHSVAEDSDDEDSAGSTPKISQTDVISGVDQDNGVTPTLEAISTQKRSLIPLDKIFKTEVKRGPRFIDIFIKMNDGNEITYSFPTYYHKWHNLDGTIGLLAYAGIKIEKPELPSELEEARNVCSALLSKTTNLIQDQINHFAEQATQVVNKVNTNMPGHSIEEAYKIWANSLSEESEKAAQRTLETL